MDDARIFFVTAKIEDTKLVLQRITEHAQRISGFEALPVTAQVSMLYDLIAEAQRHSIPLKMICEAMNDAGSTCGVRYLREALFTVRKRHKDQVGEPGPVQKTAENKATAHTPSKPVKKDNERSLGLTPKQQREAKARSYMVNDNPLLNQLKAKE